MSPARLIVMVVAKRSLISHRMHLASNHLVQLVPNYLFRILGFLMSEMEMMMMRANSLVLIWLRNSQRE